MRDMLDADEPYPLTAWSTQFDRIRLDLDDALRARAGSRWCPAGTPEQRSIWPTSVAQFWDAAESHLRPGREPDRRHEARAQIRLSLQARQAALSTAVARLLVENNEAEEQTAQQVQDIYASVQRQVYWFLGRHARRHRRYQPVPDSLEPAAVRAARRRCPTTPRAGADSSSRRANRRCARSRASCTTSSARS